MKRTPLTRKPWRRALGTAEQRLAFKRAVLEADGDCLMVGIKLCEGPLQAAHVVPKQKLRRDGHGADVVYSVDAAVTLCRRHHEQWDRGFLPHVDALLPERCRRFAVQYGRPAA